MPEANLTPINRVWTLHHIGEIPHAAGETQEAERLLSDALAILHEEIPDNGWIVGRFAFAYGRVLADLGQREAARSHLEMARGALGRIGFPDPVEDVDAEIDRLLRR